MKPTLAIITLVILIELAIGGYLFILDPSTRTPKSICVNGYINDTGEPIEGAIKNNTDIHTYIDVSIDGEYLRYYKILNYTTDEGGIFLMNHTIPMTCTDWRQI